MTIVGTSYFPCIENAITYYSMYESGETAERMAVARRVVNEKLAAGEIHLGFPPTTRGGRLLLIDGGFRWGIKFEDETGH